MWLYRHRHRRNGIYLAVVGVCQLNVLIGVDHLRHFIIRRKRHQQKAIPIILRQSLMIAQTLGHLNVQDSR